MERDPDQGRTAASDAQAARLRQSRLPDHTRSLRAPSTTIPTNNAAGPSVANTTWNIPDGGTVPSWAARGDDSLNPRPSLLKSEDPRLRRAAPTNMSTGFFSKQIFGMSSQYNRPPAGDFNEPVIDVTTGKPYTPNPLKMAVRMESGGVIVPDRRLAPPSSPIQDARRQTQQHPILKLSIPSSTEDNVTKNAAAIIKANTCWAAERDIRYTPPLIEPPGADFLGRIRRTPVDPRMIGLPQVPESRKDDGRPYAQVLVDPKLRMIQFPEWIREQWLGAEWRRCQSSEHVEVKSDRFDIIEYFQGKYAGYHQEILGYEGEARKKQEQEALQAVKEAGRVARTKKIKAEAASEMAKGDRNLKEAKERDATLAEIVEANRVAKVKRNAEEQDAAELSVVNGKEKTVKDVQEADEKIQDLYKELMKIGKAEIARKKSWWQDKKAADKDAIRKKGTLANLKTATIIAEELHEKLRMIELVETSRNQRIGAQPVADGTGGHSSGYEVGSDWVLLEDEVHDGKIPRANGEGRKLKQPHLENEIIER